MVVLLWLEFGTFNLQLSLMFQLVFTNATSLSNVHKDTYERTSISEIKYLSTILEIEVKEFNLEFEF